MAREKATKKAPAKTKAAAPLSGDIPEIHPALQKHEIHLHNVAKSPANWQISGGGDKVRGVTPPEGHSVVRVDHANRGYKITFWRKPDKKTSCKVGPDGSAIYTGSKIHITHGH